MLNNPLRPIGSPVTHENWPLNWPDFATSPARYRWPARSRHTVACMHRFSHILGRPCEPAVWFMSESRAVATSRQGKYADLPIISSSFEMATVLKGLYNASSIMPNNPLRPIGSPVTHENWPLNWPDFAASPARLCWPARSRHTVACMHRFSHILRRPCEPAVWFMSESRAVATSRRGKYADLPIISSSFEMAMVLKGLMHINVD